MNMPLLSLAENSRTSLPRMKCILAIFLTIFITCYADQIKLKIHPQPDDPKSSLIWYNESTYLQWTQKLDNFLEVYRTPSLTEGREENMIKCSYNKFPNVESVCEIRPEDMKPCSASNYFGYKSKSPCVFIELEKVLGWKPKYYSSPKSLSKTMPQNLKDTVIELTENNKRMWETIWLSCDGDTPVDKEFIGRTSILPHPGFPGYFFPYVGQSGYLNPIVAVYFEKPQGGAVINVICKAWAPGIIHDTNKLLGVARFELLVD